MQQAQFMSGTRCGFQNRPALLFSRPAGVMSIRPRGPVAIRAEAGGGLGGFFNKGAGKEDAARKALQDAFAGKKDPFALDEERRKKRGGSGGGGGGGKGGGGGGSSGGFDFDDFSDKFRKWMTSTAKAIASAVLFIGFVSLFYLWQPLLSLLNKVVRVVFRLDGNPRAQLASGPAATANLSKKEGLGDVEEEVISKWGNVGGEEDDGESEYDDEE